MATGNSVLKLVVDDKEYEASIRKAQQGLQTLEDSLNTAGKSFDQADRSVVDYTRAIGQMSTVSKTVKGRIGEMTSAFTELSVRYQNLTDKEKESPFGKALAESLGDLKTRIQDSRKQLDDINRSLQQSEETGKNTGGILGMLSDKLTLNVDAMKMFDVGLSAVKGALSVVGDAFMASEANVDEWGRVTASAKDLYDGFLTALNTGDISGYLSRINDIINAARAAYDELDKLGTMKTIQAPLVSNQQADIERLRGMLQTGTYIGKKNGYETIGNLIGLQNGDKLSPELIRVIENQLSKGTQKIVDLWDNEIDQSGKAIDALYNQQAVKIGMSLSEFRKGTSSWEEFSRNLEGYQKYQQFENEHTQVYSSYSPTLGTNVSSSHRDDVANPYEQYKRWGVFRVDGEEFNNLVSLIQQRDQQIMQAYSQQIQAQRTINRAEGFSVRQIMGSGGSGGKSGGADILPPVGSIADLNRQMQELRKAQEQVTSTDAWKEYEIEIKRLQIEADVLRGKLVMNPAGSMRGVLPDINVPTAPNIAKFSDVDRSIRSLDVSKYKKSDEKREVKLSEEIGKMNSGISSMVNGIEGLGIELPKGLKDVLGGIQSVTSILTGIATIVSTIQAISAADTIIPFANGGVVKAAGGYRVPGWTFSGDMVPARLNAGELVLNQAQAGVIANALQDREFGGIGTMQPYVEGERVYLGMENTLKRKGKGEIVTTSMLRQLGLI